DAGQALADPRRRARRPAQQGRRRQGDTARDGDRRRVAAADATSVRSPGPGGHALSRRLERTYGMADFEYPDDLRYTTQHEWVRTVGDRVRVGITAYAQDALGDIVYVSLPDTGSTISAGSSVGEVESTKSVSDLYAPASGTVVEPN